MRIVGILLVVLGLVGLLAGGFSYTRQRTVIDAGPLEARVNEKERVPISPIVGGIAIAAGLIMIVAGGRRATG